MAEPTIIPSFNAARGEWVRLRTLILLRWLAVAGQLAAVYVASQIVGIRLDLDLCLIAVLASVTFNIIATLLLPRTKRLRERDAMLSMMFDLVQLAALLYLTGGLSNPFAMLVLAPVAISATALSARPTVAVSLLAILLISALAVYNRPLVDASGAVLELPGLFINGIWVALVISVIFVASYARKITTEIFSMSQALTATQMALGREQRLTALGGVVAAAAHELGTPLATIKLVSAELAEELADRPDLREDAELIRSQADRCRDILRDMGRSGKDDSHLHHAPVLAVIEEAAEPHIDRGKEIVTRVAGTVPGPEDGRDQPEIARRPELIHGLRNLVQNAVDFSASTVWIDVDWTDTQLRITVGDDGPGYPLDQIDQIGEPFLRRVRRGRVSERRPGYEGMGMGLFIAKTLLERTGAQLTFANGAESPRMAAEMQTGPVDLARPPGAVVEVLWPLDQIVAGRERTRAALGDNPPNESSSFVNT
ncbi:sensor histidine kinase RegB [Oceanomicrobium pacificus]|uniref:histidine kinase n=1 Tax=Oceanomicrobium pacificus TaxID=2692916 RepID=A0A6B0TJS5_9RHOB|nr:ActS/PrrB/RegB family redox-sensitive histidine kinase [Oceanomicrobium pacificus]MXU64740.1 ActS/PrrB/RegB family redox-sensitive histidine kinase [Oceanomicrobium pacificus]